ncbi:MAG: ABC transporter ATP-binding protein [Chlorobia bacterium]|nr:ABC transporter ATP-binding protein [Fimbriimonadaceae bacterium]
MTTFLTTATLPLMRGGIQAITDAAGYTEQKMFLDAEIEVIAKDLGKQSREVAQALSPIQKVRDASGAIISKSEIALAAESLKVTTSAFEQAVTKARGGLAKKRSPQEALALLGKICLLVIGLFALKYWFTRGQSYYLSKAAARLASNLRVKLYTKLQRLPVSYFNQKRSGATQSVLTNDVGVYQTAVTIIRDSIDGPLKALGALGYIFYTQWQLGLITLFFLPPMAIAIQRNARKMKQAQRTVQSDLANLNAMTLESLQGTRVVKAFAAEDRMEEEYSGLVERTFESQMRATRRNASLRPLVELIGAVALAVFLYASGVLAYRGVLQVADLIALIAALDIINQGSRNIASVNNTYAQVQAASERIYSEVLDVPDEHFESVGKKTIPNPSGRIVFEGVSFQYPDGTQALDQVNFTLEPGTSLALVGPSGAGKSTIADLLLRFYDPSAGRITFDGIDIRELDTPWLRNQIGVVPQQTFLFAGSLAENIRLGRPDATEGEVEDAARAAHVDVFAASLPEKYETVIGEQGSGLSGGERQRVAIARALVRKPTLLLLDEATSALDASSERAVTEALDEIMRQRTTLFIAHRLTTAARADRILYLRRGQVVEEGPHKDLMDRNGEYAALFRVFSNGVLDNGLE